ncbi:CLUMA_CG001419, isoform A [Clunio marinus]|uniref:CLUMA_CG001419, isoform A n=1 Tax=Clunio marinus TaxID=568069 RepID=A0A1J1HHW0_9DIPT|nr:CLUMA_CG001419, isoform A [Clunio marinus]
MRIIVSKFHALLIATTCISYWRGVWKFLDIAATISETNHDIPITPLFDIAQNSIILMISKTFVNNMSVPFVVMTDQLENSFHIPTIFKRKRNDGTLKFFFDCLYTNLIPFFMICLWRSFWVIIDANVFPNNPMTSAYISITTGYTLSLFCFMSESFIENLYNERCDEYKFFVRDVFTVVCLFASINVWRGLWIVFDAYIGNRNGVLFLVNGLAWKFLMILNCTSSISPKGVLKDGEDLGNGPIRLPILYFQQIFKSVKLQSEFIDQSNSTKL